METSVIYVQDEKDTHIKTDNTPSTIFALANKMIDEARLKSEILFENIEIQFQQTFTRPSLTNEKRLELADNELAGLEVHLNELNLANSPDKLRADVIARIKEVADILDDKDIIWKHHTDNQILIHSL